MNLDQFIVSYPVIRTNPNISEVLKGIGDILHSDSIVVANSRVIVNAIVLGDNA